LQAFYPVRREASLSERRRVLGPSETSEKDLSMDRTTQTADRAATSTRSGRVGTLMRAAAAVFAVFAALGVGPANFQGKVTIGGQALEASL